MTTNGNGNMATTEHSELNDKHNGRDHDPELGRMEALKQFRSAASITMSPELFEKLYLSPHNVVKGDLRQTFGNPTPIALVGFLLALGPLSCDLMGWRGAGGSGAASNAIIIFMGGLLMFTGGILEWVLGNSFPSVVFCTYGGFYFSYGSTLIPSFAAFSSYAPADAKSPAEGLATEGFNASFGFVLLFMALVTTVFLLVSFRTNVVFVSIFFTLAIGLYLLTAGFWTLAMGNAGLATKLIKGGGACAFVTVLGGWYILIAILLAVVDFPFQIPVGDLSRVIKGKSEKNRVD
ncbi:hypothetical protein G7046_g4862 [Stylonectria norvegica]|nr:hypothetical protein G7046_g4862 [Stylonectria norvegica]